jgi:elongation factor 2
MSRFRQIPEIQTLMRQKEFIRNLGIVAHIDHGKTTTADSLIAGTGLLSPKMVGTARILDYLEEEQRRKITIKTANISLLHKTSQGTYIINLVDTPGHVDFTGKVTRALRSIDGAIVVVDAAEEIMAQTEVVTRQVLEERVRPVLFINKVDRLITELQLSQKEIEKKLDHILAGFNDLIELYGEPAFKDHWKINPSKDNLVFGSALHGWGFTLNIAKKQNVKFQDIISAYRKKEHEKLQNALPIQRSLFEIAIKSIPNPIEAQKYRTKKLWKGKTDSEIGISISECSDLGSAVFCATTVQIEPENTLATGRLFSGNLKVGDKIYLVNAKEETTIDQIFINMGSFKESINEVWAGNIATLSLPIMVKAGETLVDPAQKDIMTPFEKTKYFSEPVITIAIEPKNPRNLPILLQSMDKLMIEDPNLSVSIDKETGEYLLSGMGELHLEIAVNQLRNELDSFEIETSSPRVVYRESPNVEGAPSTARSPNRHNSFTVQTEPMAAETTQIIDSYKNSEGSNSVLAIDEYRNILVKRSSIEIKNPEIEAFIIAGFEYACNAGPLSGEPLKNVKITLTDIQLSANPELSHSAEIMHGISKAIFGSFLTAKPHLLEPIYKTVISTPTEIAGECSRIICSRRGKISSFKQNGSLTIITGSIPVAETLGLSKELRSATSGRAFWQNILENWDPLSEKLEAKIISELRAKKGLPPEVPPTTKFTEEI